MSISDRLDDGRIDQAVFLQIAGLVLPFQRGIQLSRRGIFPVSIVAITAAV
jgi:hypothetical protein